MSRNIVLSAMSKGKTYQVAGFAQAGSEYAIKLHKMGFVVGTTVELAQVKLADPMVIQIRGSRVALRKNEAEQVFVEEVNNA